MCTSMSAKYSYDTVMLGLSILEDNIGSVRLISFFPLEISEQGWYTMFKTDHITLNPLQPLSFFHSKFKFHINLILLYFNFFHHTTTNFCTCHNSWAFATCAKFCGGQVFKIWIEQKVISTKFDWWKKSLVEWLPGFYCWIPYGVSCMWQDRRPTQIPRLFIKGFPSKASLEISGLIEIMEFFHFKWC